MNTILTPTPNPGTITNINPPATPRCGLNETGICCKKSDTAHSQHQTGPLTIFSRPEQARLGSGKSGGVGMAHCPLQLLMAWGVLPPAWSVREPLMGTCGLIAGS
jgi:hypothetical protein